MIDFNEENKRIYDLPCNVERRERNRLCIEILKFFGNLAAGNYKFKGKKKYMRMRRIYFIRVVHGDNPLDTTQINYWNSVDRWVPLSYEESLENLQWIWGNREQIVKGLGC